MDISKEEFDEKYREVLDTLLKGMAEDQEIDVRKFYGLTTFIENLMFFSPVFYGLLENAKKP